MKFSFNCQKRTNDLTLKGAEVCVILEKGWLGTSPQYLLAIEVKPTDANSDIYVEWNTTVRWNTNEGKPKEFFFENSEMFTESGFLGQDIDPIPGKSSELEISIEITTWNVTTKHNQKRAPEPLNTGPIKISRISSENDQPDELSFLPYSPSNSTTDSSSGYCCLPYSP